MRGCDPDNNTKAGEFEEALEDEAPADLVGARVDGLVNERRGPPEIAQVLEVDVLWVRAALVQLGQWVSLSWMEVCVTEVAVREGIRSTLEEDNDGMELAHGANAGVVDVVVDKLGRNVEIHGSIDAVAEGYNVPYRIEALQCGRVSLGGVVVVFLRDAGVCTFRLP